MTHSLAASAGQEKLHLSAQDLADAVGISKSQALYWGRVGFLKRRSGGHKIYPFAELRKAELLAFLINDVGLDGAKATGIADGLLRMVEDEPRAVDTLLELLHALHGNLEAVVSALARSDIYRELVGVATEEEVDQ